MLVLYLQAQYGIMLFMSIFCLISLYVDSHGVNMIHEVAKESHNHSMYPAEDRSTIAHNLTCNLEDSKFIEDSSYRHFVALASYPRSGNSFLRGLLERSTGFVTCARGSDYKLMALGFQGHRIDPFSNKGGSRCLVHKTHTPMNSQIWEKENAKQIHQSYPASFDRVIMLVRNPFDVAMSSFHYFQTDNHTGIALNPDGSTKKIQRGHAISHAQMWAKHIQFWLKRSIAASTEYGNKTMDKIESSLPSRFIVRYEDLKRQPEVFATRIIQWLGLPPDQKLLDCALSHANNMVRQISQM